MSGSQTISTSDTRIEALKLQSSAYGVTIPVAYGVTWLKGNLLWFGGFQAIPHTTETNAGKGGGVKTQHTTYTYSASVAMGLCHGQITGVPRIKRGKKLYEGGVLPAQVITVSETHFVPAAPHQITLLHAANYTAIVQAMSDWNSDGGGVSPLSQGWDYSVANGVVTFQPTWQGRAITITYQYTEGALELTALQELDLTFKPGALGQSVWSHLSTSHPTEAIGYSGLAYVAGQDYDLGTGAQVENHLFEVQAPMAYHLGPDVPDVDLALVVQDICTNSRYGGGAQCLDAMQDWSDYCVATDTLVSPAIEEQTPLHEVVTLATKLGNAEPVWSGGRLKIVPYSDAPATGNSRTYTPNTTPVYDFDDDSYIVDGAEPPVRMERKEPSQRYNHVRVEYRNRGKEYAIEIAEAKDQADIDATGLRSMPIVRAHWICRSDTARQVAQTMMQRALYVVATYQWKASINFCLLEQMDLVTLTDPVLGLSKWPVRITEVEEGEDGEVLFTAEDYPAGVVSATQYPSQAGSGYIANYRVLPGSVAAPVIFELPGDLAASGLEIAVAARGASAAWGGCRVWVSMDGTQYRQVGIIEGGSRYGALTGAVSGGVMPVVINGGQLLSGTAADAAALNTLCYVGGSAPEFLAYQTATLTGANTYNLGGLVRGAYQSNGASAHAGGDPFVRVDDAIARSGAIDRGYIGKTIYIKCTSFNLFGASEESLADVSAYSYTVTGKMFGRGKLYRAVSVGQGALSAGGYPAAPGLYDAETGAQLLTTVARSYIFARVRRSDDVITFQRQYDVYGSGASGGYTAADLAADLNATGPDHYVVVITTDEPQANRTNGGLADAMYRCGASRGVFGSPRFAARGSYVLISIAGCGEGNGFEAYQGEPISGGDPNAWCDVAFQTRKGSLIVTGTGATPRSLADYSYTGDLDATHGATFGVNVFGQAATSHIAPGAATEVIGPVESAKPYPVTYDGTGLGDGLFVDGYAITPSIDCYAELTITVDASAPQSNWGRVQVWIAAGMCAESSLVPWFADGNFSEIDPTAVIQNKNGLTDLRATYTVVGRFPLTAGVPVRLGLVAKGSDTSSLYRATVYAMSYSVTLVKR